MINETLVQLKADFVCEALDLGGIHSVWCFRHLQEGRYPQALAAFEKLVATVRSAATEMASIRKMVDDKKLMAEAAAEYRQDRDRHRPGSRSASAVSAQLAPKLGEAS